MTDPGHLSLTLCIPQILSGPMPPGVRARERCHEPLCIKEVPDLFVDHNDFFTSPTLHLDVISTAKWCDIVKILNGAAWAGWPSSQQTAICQRVKVTLAHSWALGQERM
jgi:hypothetical protein